MDEMSGDLSAGHEVDGMDDHGGLPQGLAVSADGYTLHPAATVVSTGETVVFSFRVLDPAGAPLLRYTPVHERELHLIVVRRDLAVYQHLHPTRAADGTWSVPLTLPDAGVYKAFAAFQPAGEPMPMPMPMPMAMPLTLAVDLFAPGDFQPAPLPAPVVTTTVEGYTVALTGTLVPGQGSDLTFTFAKDGMPVTDLEPYLGAYGHLVALRVGDLAYLHVHPEGAPGDGQTGAGPEVTFQAEVPTAGSYRLFADFQHGGVVRTAEFTAVAPRAGHHHIAM